MLHWLVLGVGHLDSCYPCLYSMCEVDGNMNCQVWNMVNVKSFDYDAFREQVTSLFQQRLLHSDETTSMYR